MNDGLNILKDGMGAARQFPVVYIAILMCFRKVGQIFGDNYNLAIALYSWCQIIVMSFLTSAILTWVKARTKKIWLFILSLLYFAFVPVFPNYAISMLKDTPWSILIAICTILIYEMFYRDLKQDRRFWCFTGLVLLGIVLLRSNGIYIAMPLLLLLLISRRKYLKQILLLIASCFLVFGISSAITPSAYFQEKAAIPLQQVCAVVAYDGEITQEQEEFISNIMSLDDIKENYTPSTVDNIKWCSGKFTRLYLQEHSGQFLKVWAQMLPKNFKIYVKAYLDETLYFWAPLPHKTQAFYTIQTYENNTWLIGFCEEKNIHDAAIIGGAIGIVLRAYYRLASYFLGEAILWWIVVVSLIILSIKTKRWKEYVIIYLPLILLWLTIMISAPVASSLRYVIAFAYVLPVLAVFLTNSRKIETKEGA